MKNKASVFLKQIMALLSSIAKSKSMAIKSKTDSFRARLVMFSLMKSKKVLLGSISNKIHGILGHHHHHHHLEENDDLGDRSKAIVLYNNAAANEPNSSTCVFRLVENCTDDDHEQAINGGDQYHQEDDDDKYPDLRHCLFDEEDDFNDPGGSIIDLVKNSKEDNGEDFSLEDEIDHAADLFIMRFHKQMRLQKLESFKRFQEMLDRSV